MGVQSPLLTAQETMSYLRKSRPWLTRHADEIGCVRDGNRLYFRLTRLDAWIERHEVLPPRESKPVGVERRARAVPGLGRINPVTNRPYGAYGPAFAASTAAGAHDAREPKRKARASL